MWIRLIALALGLTPLCCFSADGVEEVPSGGPTVDQWREAAKLSPPEHPPPGFSQRAPLQSWGPSCGPICDGPHYSGCGCGELWVEADFLLWWIKGNRLPPLVTTNTDIPDRDLAGVLGHDTTRILFGSDRVDAGERPGGRVTAVYWPNPCWGHGIELNWFSIGKDSDDFFRQSPGDPVLARPFSNVDTNEQDAQLIAYPDVVSGQTGVMTSSEMHSAAVLWRTEFCGTRCKSIDLVAGYRYLRFREGLRISEDLTSTDPGGLIEQGTQIEVFDRFRVNNDFHGFEFGVVYRALQPRWSLASRAKLAIGGLSRRLSIDGATVVTTPGDSPVTSSGGLLALPTNIGRHKSTEFAFLPQIEVDFRHHVSCNIDFKVGYSLLILTDVVRTGDSIDLAVNPTQLPAARGGSGTLVGEPRPTVLFGDSTLWAQGLNVGFEWRR